MEGIVVAADEKQEWLLPWWWERYAKHNRYPVLFVNFGMTWKAVAWCKERGKIAVPLALSPAAAIPRNKRKDWEKLHGKGLWDRRAAWMKKPSAMLLAPFEKSIWLDLDCEVHGSLAPLFQILTFGVEIALSGDFLWSGRDGYNSGVIAFRKGSSIFPLWLKRLSEQAYLGDQDALTEILKERGVFTLPRTFNWSPMDGKRSDALITHYHGNLLKALLVYNLNAARYRTLLDKQDVTFPFDPKFY